MNRINGKAFDVRIGLVKVHFDSFTATIEDGSTVAMTKGMPDGNLPGDVKCSGELEIDSANFMLLSVAARAAGSWEKLPAFNIDAYAAGENASLGTELFQFRGHDCKLRLADILNVNPNTSEKTTHKIKYDVTGRDFVWVNGTPYLDASGFSLF